MVVLRRMSTNFSSTLNRLRVVQDQRDSEKVEYLKDSINGFKEFLKLFDDKRVLLPEWWAEDKAEECVKYGGDGWSSLHRMIVKKEVNEHYGNQRFGLQFRLFGEKVLWHCSCGDSLFAATDGLEAVGDYGA